MASVNEKMPQIVSFFCFFLLALCHDMWYSLIEVIVVTNFQDMLIYFRKRAGLSQAELAEKIGVGRSTIGMYENGNRQPDFETLEALADFFNVNMSTLLGEPDNKPWPTPVYTPEKQQLLNLVDGMTDDQAEKALELIKIALQM